MDKKLKWDRKALIESLQRIYDAHEIATIVHVDPLARMLMENPDAAIDEIVRVYDAALDDAYTHDGENVRSYIETTCGGPHEAVPHSIYNAVGQIYPFLDRARKNKALGRVLSILDRLNYGIVNTIHTPGIREPLLLSDIQITRPYYWPGLHDEERLWKDKATFFDLQAEIMDERGLFDRRKVQSDFLVAYAIMRSDFTPFGEDYVKEANPAFLERVLQGIVALRFARAETPDDIEKGKKRLIELLPASVHERLEPIRQKADWVDVKLFP